MAFPVGTLRHEKLRDIHTPHWLAELEAAVCSETEADSKISTHQGDASAHHAKTSDAGDITSGTFAEARIPAHMDKGKLAFTADKLLKGSGAGAAPTEIDVPDPGEGHIAIMPDSYDSIGQGTWAWSSGSGMVWNHAWMNPSHTDEDNISYKVFLPAGTYTLELLAGKTGLAYGRLYVDIDSTPIAMFDLYDPAAPDNKRFTDINTVISTPGLKTLKLRVNGKNASAIDYYVNWLYIALWRTA
ncbi:MAG: hypothetical protein H8E40_12805 [Chloroflexi bacterium]|nr:hypothetical protein [Chloroflexota bacterium]